MKYQSEYTRSYQNRSPTKFQELTAEERKLNEVPFERSPSRRRRRRSLPERTDLYDNYAVMGPNDKFSESRLYRLKEPVKDNTRVPKSQEYALLGRNEKFENNVVYPLRKPVVTESPRRVVVRRRKKENHSCGIQTELRRTTSASQNRRDDRNRSRYAPQSEYRHSYNWEKPSTEQSPSKDLKPREQRPNPPQVSTSVGVNTPARIDIDVNKTKHQAKRTGSSSKKVSKSKRDETTEYRARYKPTTTTKKPSIQKAYEAEQIDERKQRQTKQQPRERAYSDDEGAYENVNLGNEFRQRYPYGKLRRWKSEYQSTYKPFWRYDYKNGKWYKDTSADEKGFNPNLYWYQELLSTRKRAEQFRANAETDHFNPNHTLQLQTGFSLNNNYRAWDTDDDDSVISVDRDLERERIEGERRREKDAERVYPKKEKSSTIKTDQIAQTEHQVDRVIYVDEPPPKEPSAATKAFVRNLSSSSVKQQMSWDSESLYSQRTNSDQNSHRKYQNTILQPSSMKKTGRFSPISSDRQAKYTNNGYNSPKISDRMTPQRDTTANDHRPATSYQETTKATGQPSYDANSYEKRPQTSMNEYCTYPASRFKDEVTEYYYRNGDQRQTPVSKPSYSTNDKLYNQTYNPRNKDDDVLSNNSARSLSSSCSLASQTLERAQGNLNKYWGDNSPTSPKKPYSAKN